MKERPKMEHPVRMFDLAALDKPAARPSMCGGAIVYVTRSNFEATKRDLNVDLMLPPVLPEGDARFEARVPCGAQATSAGLCVRCAKLERHVRAVLAEAKARQP